MNDNDYPILRTHWADLDDDERQLYKLACFDMPVSYQALVGEVNTKTDTKKDRVIADLEDELKEADATVTQLDNDLDRAQREVDYLKARLDAIGVEVEKGKDQS